MFWQLRCCNRRLSSVPRCKRGLLDGETRGARIGQFITGDVSPEALPDLVAVLRSEGLHAATDAARAMTVEQRAGVFDALSHYVCTFTREALHEASRVRCTLRLCVLAG